MSEPEVSVTVCPDGPLLVRGPLEFATVDGQTVTSPRNVVALCRCGRSRLKPLCDGSHRSSRFRDQPDGAVLQHRLVYATDPPSADPTS